VYAIIIISIVIVIIIIIIIIMSARDGVMSSCFTDCACVVWSSGNNSITKYLHTVSTKNDQEHEDSGHVQLTLDCPIDVVREPGFNSTVTVIKDVPQIKYIGEVHTMIHYSIVSYLGQVR